MAISIRKVTGIAMGVMSAAEIISLSEGELTEISEEKRPISDITTKTIDPIYHPRQGVFPDPYGEACLVCASKKQCPGHPMHINLEYPAINPCLIKEVVYTLSCICPHCKRTIYPEQKCQTLNIQSVGIKRMKAIQKRVKKDKICFWDDCQRILPQYEPRGEYVYYWYEGSEKNEEENENDEDEDSALSTTPIRTTGKGKGKGKIASKKKLPTAKAKKSAIKKDVYEIIELFKCISQDDFDNLGFNHKLAQNPIYTNPNIQVRAGQVHRLSFRPEDMIITAFPIASKIITAQDEETDDTIAVKYRNILKNNIKLMRHRTGKTPIDKEKDLQDLRHKITQDVCVLVDNTSTKSMQPHNHREMRTFAHFIKGRRNKMAIFRNNINGKRLEGNARTVISPGPFQKAYELGIAHCIADVLTTEFTVWKYNIQEFQKYIDNALENGEKIPYVTRRQRKTYLKFATKNYKEKYTLQEGDTVALKLESGMWGHFNRQPSLHIESYQGVRTKVLPKGMGKNFRLPLCVVTPYNADFDGALEC